MKSMANALCKGPSQAAALAHAFYREVAKTGRLDETDQRWTCYCAKRMIPTYEAIIAAQKELDELSAPFGGSSDGWGTPGN